MLGFSQIALLLPLALASPAAAPMVQDRAVFAPERIVTVQLDERLFKSCRRKARKVYGPVKGRHSSSLRIGVINQCVFLGGKLP